MLWAARIFLKIFKENSFIPVILKAEYTLLNRWTCLVYTIGKANSFEKTSS